MIPSAHKPAWTAGAHRLDTGDGRGLRSALVASIAACGIPLITGIAGDWSPARIALYAGLAVVFTLLTQCVAWPSRVARRLRRSFGAYLVLIGCIGMLLQALSVDPFFQPIIFTIPFVDASLHYERRRTAMAGAFLISCMIAGLWIGGVRDQQGLIFAPIAYGTLMVFMDAFTRLAAEQEAARLRADRLAAELAAERDYLQQLIAAAATLTRELADQRVLEQIAAHGRTLAHASVARVWLYAASSGQQPPSVLELAASVPPPDDEPEPEALVEQAIHSGTAMRQEMLLALPLVAQGRVIGVLELRDATAPGDLDRLKPFADIAATAIQNANLYAQAQDSATYAERNRLARELHDTIAQGLAAVTMQLEASQRSLDRAPERARIRLERATELTRATLADVRRSVWTLAAPLVDGHSLPDALETLARRAGERTALLVAYQHHGTRPLLDHGVATQLLRIVQEAVLNVEKHADASRLSIMSTFDNGMLTLVVEDDGQGFEPDSLPAPTEDGHGFGLLSIYERARLAGATLTIDSAPGHGTRVVIVVQAGVAS